MNEIIFYTPIHTFIFFWFMGLLAMFSLIMISIGMMGWIRGYMR